jgi:hypothetical protein
VNGRGLRLKLTLGYDGTGKTCSSAERKLALDGPQPRLRVSDLADAAFPLSEAADSESHEPAR